MMLKSQTIWIDVSSARSLSTPLRSGFNFNNILCKAFASKDPISAKYLTIWLYFYALGIWTSLSLKCWWYWPQVLISTTFYAKLLQVQIPKAQKDTYNLTVLKKIGVTCPIWLSLLFLLYFLSSFLGEAGIRTHVRHGSDNLTVLICFLDLYF